MTAGLLIVAADHPARGALGVGSDPMAMADRYDLLQRLATALARPGVDGVLGTPDIIGDLALLGLLGDKIVVGSMNRGGLRGSAFEMDDRYTAYHAGALVRDGLTSKVLVRVDPRIRPRSSPWRPRPRRSTPAPRPGSRSCWNRS